MEPAQARVVGSSATKPARRNGRSPLTVARAVVDLARPGNCAIAALGVLVGILLAHPAQWNVRLAFAPIAAALLTGFGNALNDLGDAHVDAVAHPARPLPSGRLSPRQANLFAGWCAGAATGCAYVAGGLPLMGFAGAVLALLVVYEAGLKRRGLAGNVVVALLTAATFIFGALAGHATDFSAPLQLAAMAFFVNLGREVVKDVEDMQADTGHRRTLPMQVGRGPALAAATMAVAVGTWWSSQLVAPWDHRFVVGEKAWMLIVLADAGVLVAAGLSFWRPAVGQRGLKLGMLTALLGVVVHVAKVSGLLA